MLSTGLVFFFRSILQKGSLPAEWLTATVIPIFKKGSRLKCSNYRPISLTCTICKVFERLIKDKMMLHLIRNNLLHSSQHAFLPKRSCCSALLTFLNAVTSAIDNHQNADAIFLDLSKAFDSVSHRRLILKLESFGFSGNVLNWIRAYLYNRSQRVQIGNSFSAYLPVISGVPQGSVLGPLLFLIFMDDLDDYLQDSKIIKFADDAKIFVTFPMSSPSYTVRLQDDLSRVAEWCSTWHLSLNLDKCTCIHFGLHNKNKTYFIGNKAVCNSNSVTDLGVLITKDLKPSS